MSFTDKIDGEMKNKKFKSVYFRHSKWHIFTVNFSKCTYIFSSHSQDNYNNITYSYFYRARKGQDLAIKQWQERFKSSPLLQVIWLKSHFFYTVIIIKNHQGCYIHVSEKGHFIYYHLCYEWCLALHFIGP